MLASLFNLIQADFDFDWLADVIVSKLVAGTPGLLFILRFLTLKHTFLERFKRQDLSFHQGFPNVSELTIKSKKNYYDED